MAEAKTPTETATFAGGCFWCTHADFEKVPGVIQVVSGYTGGQQENPTYREVCSGTTGHVEAIEVIFDPAEVTYPALLEVFWRHIDPTDSGGQFVDRGPQYRPVIFYHTEVQKRLAEASRAELDSSGRFNKPIAVDILPAEPFYRAEAYHQDYSGKNPSRYTLYRFHSGRDQFLGKVWSRKTS